MGSAQETPAQSFQPAIVAYHVARSREGVNTPVTQSRRRMAQHIPNKKVGGAMAASALYAIQVRAGTEERTRKSVLRHLAGTVEDCFVPQYETLRAERGEWKHARMRLLPGYIFIQTKQPEELVAKLAAVPAFTRLLGGNGEHFTPLSADEVAWLNAFANVETHVVPMSTGIIEGDRVLVMHGPLKGHELEIKKIDRHKREAELEVPLLGRKKRVKVGLEVIAKR